jgi:hypothetical protein
LRGSRVAPILAGITIKGLAICPSFPSYLAVNAWPAARWSAMLRQFALVEGFFCASRCRIGKQENFHGL